MKSYEICILAAPVNRVLILGCGRVMTVITSLYGQRSALIFHSDWDLTPKSIRWSCHMKEFPSFNSSVFVFLSRSCRLLSVGMNSWEFSPEFRWHVQSVNPDRIRCRAGPLWSGKVRAELVAHRETSQILQSHASEAIPSDHKHRWCCRNCILAP